MQRRMSLRETDRGVFATERRKPCDSEVELGGVQLRARDAWSPQKLRGKKRLPL